MEHHPSKARLTDADRLALQAISARHAIREIAAEVCAQTGLTEADIFSRSTAKEHVLARDVVCLIARREGWSLPEIGRAIGRDHSSVLAAVRRETCRRKLAKGEA